MTQMGQNDQFPPPNLSAGCGFSKQTLAGAHGNDEVAPITAIYATRMGLAGSTHSKSSRLADLRYELDDYLRPGSIDGKRGPLSSMSAC
jgi:hypothetical protein